MCYLLCFYYMRAMLIHSDESMSMLLSILEVSSL